MLSPIPLRMRRILTFTFSDSSSGTAGPSQMRRARVEGIREGMASSPGDSTRGGRTTFMDVPHRQRRKRIALADEVGADGVPKVTKGKDREFK